MRKYFATLHTKSAPHKKRFALLVSGGFTLIMFSIWTLTTFGRGGTLAQEEAKENEVGPIQSLTAAAGEGIEGLRNNVKALFNIYGR